MTEHVDVAASAPEDVAASAPEDVAASAPEDVAACAPADFAGIEPEPELGRRTAIHGGLWSAAAQTLPSAGIALLSIVAGRTLGSQGLGQQSLIAYVATSLVVVAGSVNSALLIRLGPLQEATDQEILRAAERRAIRIAVGSGVVTGLLLLVIGVVWPEELLAWSLLAVTSAINGVIAGIAVVVAAREGWSSIGRLQLLWSIFVGPLGVVALALGLGIPGIFAADVLVSAGMVASLLRRYPDVARGWLRHRTAVNLDIRRPLQRFMTSNVVSQIVDRRIEFVALALLSTDSEIAYYSVAYMIVNLLALLPTLIATASLPLTAAADTDERRESLHRNFRLAARFTVLLSIPLTAGMAVVGPTVVRLFYGNHFGSAADLVPIESIVLLVTGLGGVTNQYWAGRNRLGAVIAVGIVAGTVDLATAFGLVPGHGALGAVIANVVGQVVATAGIVTVTRRREGAFGFRRRNLGAMAAAAVVALLLAYAVDRGMRAVTAGANPLVGHLAVVASVTACFVVVTVAMCVGLKIIDLDEYDWLAPVLPGVLARPLRLLVRGSPGRHAQFPAPPRPSP